MIAAAAAKIEGAGDIEGISGAGGAKAAYQRGDQYQSNQSILNDY